MSGLCKSAIPFYIRDVSENFKLVPINTKGQLYLFSQFNGSQDSVEMSVSWIPTQLGEHFCLFHSLSFNWLRKEIFELVIQCFPDLICGPSRDPSCSYPFHGYCTPRSTEKLLIRDRQIVGSVIKNTELAPKVVFASKLSFIKNDSLASYFCLLF